MSSRPGLGEISITGVTSGGIPLNAAGANAKAPTKTGAWRPDINFETNEALKVTLRAERGVTPPGLLTVPYRFQGPPVDRFGRPITWDYPTTDTLRAGQQIGKGSKTLRVQSFSTLFVDVDQDQPWVTWKGSYDVQRLLEELTAIGDALATFRLTVGQPGLWGPKPLVNMLAVLTALTPEQRGGSLGTEYTDIEFHQVKPQRLTRERARRPASHAQARRHTRVHGDTLYSIARHYYEGQASLWRGIAKANGITNVGAGSSEALEDWCASHHRTTLTIPPSEDKIKFEGFVT